MAYVVTLIIVGITSFLFVIYKFSKKENTNIPGPKGLPLIGNALDVDFDTIHFKLFEWKKTYGDIFKISIFGQTFVVVNSSKLVRELFTKEPNATLTSARPDTFAKKYLVFNVDVIFTSLDKEWLKRRKLMYTLIHAYGEGLKNIEKEITVKLIAIKTELCKEDQGIINPSEIIEDFVLSLIQILLVGKSCSRGSEFHRYISEYDDVGNDIANPGVDTLYNIFPFLRFIPLSSTAAYNSFIEMRAKLLSFLDQQSDIDKTGIYRSIKELMTGESSDKKDAWLSKTMAESLLTNIMGAAYLTTRSALLSLIRILMSSLEVQTKLQEEVDRVVGHDRCPLLSDRRHMPFTEAVILETLRLISNVPLSILHSTSEDVLIGDFIIPKDTVVIPNLWTMHHDEREWSDPFKFDPDRFLGNNGELLPHDHDIRKKLLVFGCGKRSCLGEVLAKSRMFLFLSSMMQDFSINPPNEEDLPTLDPKQMKPGIVLQPYPYKCKFVPRRVQC